MNSADDLKKLASDLENMGKEAAFNGPPNPIELSDIPRTKELLDKLAGFLDVLDSVQKSEPDHPTGDELISAARQQGVISPGEAGWMDVLDVLWNKIGGLFEIHSDESFWGHGPFGGNIKEYAYPRAVGEFNATFTV